MHIGSIILVSLGVLFLLLGAIGILRFPDCYTRMHAAGKCDTLGSLLVVSGLAFYHGASLESATIARAALRRDLPLWTKGQSR
jgi:multicomponent Na+:H+ antiporter subunit G